MATLDSAIQDLTRENPEQADRFMDALGYTNSPNTITSADFSPISEPRVARFTPPQVPNVSNLPQAEIKTPDAVDPLGELEDIEQRISGFDVEAGVRTQTTEQQRALNELNKRIQLQQVRAERAAAAAAERGETLGFASLEVQKERRESAFEAMELSALAQAAQGELLLARDLAGDAVKTQFEQLEKEARTKRQNIIDNFDKMTPEQKRRAEETLRRLDKEDAFIEEEKDRREQIQEIALDYASKTGDVAGAEEIRKQTDPVRAAAIAKEKAPAPSLREEGDGGGFTFSSTQKNTGAANAGVTAQEFNSLPPTVQNTFINDKDAASLLVDDVAQFKSGDFSYDEALADINAQSVPDEVKQYFTSLLGERPQTTESGGGFFDFIGRLFNR